MSMGHNGGALFVNKRYLNDLTAPSRGDVTTSLAADRMRGLATNVESNGVRGAGLGHAREEEHPASGGSYSRSITTSRAQI